MTPDRKMGDPKNSKEQVALMCRKLLEAIEKEIAIHQQGKRGLLTPTILVLVREQVKHMMSVLDPKKFTPSYPGNLIGSWMDDPLGVKLMELSYFYKQL